MSGAPCIVGHRITVAAIKALLGHGFSAEKIVTLYGGSISTDDVEAARQYDGPLG